MINNYLLAAALLASLSSHAPSADPLPGEVVAARRGGEVEVVVRGLGDWRVNADYPARLTLGSAVLRASDGTFSGLSSGKAAALVWRVASPAEEGSVRAVFCDASRCSSPVVLSFRVAR